MARTRTVDSRRDLEELVDEYVDKGYKVTNTGDDISVVKDRDLGGWVIHLLLLIFTIGLGNVLYAVYRWVTADTVKIVVGSTTE